jgi:Immunity protein 30
MNTLTLDELVSRLEFIDKNKGDNYFDEFIEIVCEIGKLNKPESISALSNFFNDDAPEEDLMFAIIHVIEDFSDETYINEILQISVDLYKSSPQWCLVVFMRILNSDPCRLELVKQLRSSLLTIKKVVRDIMEEINKSDTIFLAKTVAVTIAAS